MHVWKHFNSYKTHQKLSEHIKLANGAEQGHPLSPELFKIFIHDLSTELNFIKANTPELNNFNISHLFWAYDLVLFGLSEDTLQTLINILSNFCKTWGLTVNPKKTKIMIFNKAGRHIYPKNEITLKIARNNLNKTFNNNENIKVSFDLKDAIFLDH